MSAGRRHPRDDQRIASAAWPAAALAYGVPAVLFGLDADVALVPLLATAAFLLFGILSARLAPRVASLTAALAFLAPALAEAWAITEMPARGTFGLGPLALLAVFGIFHSRTMARAAVIVVLLFAPPLAALFLTGIRSVDAAGLMVAAGAIVLALALARERRVLLQAVGSLEEELMQRSAIDQLTGVLQRSAFESRAPERMWLCALRDAPVSLLRMDLDRLKRLNEKLGYAAGDTLIQQLGELIRRQLRQGDLVARLGGGDFVALLPGASLDAALRVAERIRRECERLSEPSGCTLSAGVAQRHRDESLAELLARADAALERAKRLGRNRVEVSHLEAGG